MDLRLADLSPGRRYKLMTALVVPRPIAWITTRGADGHVNAAPFSYFNVMGSDPVVVAVGFADRADGARAGALKDTPRLIRETGRFVVNTVDEGVDRLMHATSGDYAPGESELAALGVGTAPMPGADGAPWDVPRIAAAPAALACREHATHLVGRTRVVLGVAEALWVRDGLVDARGYVDLDAVRAVGRLGGGRYTRTRDHLSHGPRPEIRP